MNTRILEDKLRSCANIREYQHLVQEHAAQYAGWNKHICGLLRDRCCREEKSNAALAQACGIKDPSYVKKQLKDAIPAERNQVIALAMVLKLNLDETNELLVKHARYHRLYSRNPDDAIWIYIIEKRCTGVPIELFEAYKKVYEEETDHFIRTSAPMHPLMGTRILQDNIRQCAAKSSRAAIQEPANDQFFREMVRQNLPDYIHAYHRLMDYLDKRMLMFPSANVMFADNKSFKNTYYEKMRELRNEHKLPSRNFLIALGLRLAMTKKELNEMLDLASMGSLYAKDRLESAIIFLLEDLYRNIPAVFPGYWMEEISNDTQYDPRLDDLYSYDTVQDNDPAFERVDQFIARRLGEFRTANINEDVVEKFLKMM